MWTPTPLPFDPLGWAERPLAEQAGLACRAWAVSGFGAPAVVYALYAVKVALYVGGWVLCCGFSDGLGGPSTLAEWWFRPEAFQKAMLFSMLFEGLGLGCGSGPLTGRYLPPVGGALYFLRPGTTKLARWPRLPLLGGCRRTWFDVAIYAALLFFLLRALVAPRVETAHLLPIVALCPLFAVTDRPVFLALRPEHYWTTLVVFAAAPTVRVALAGAMAVQLALWFWAGVSKLNHHFPTVVCVMTSNSPFTAWGPFRRWMYRAPPLDLRPSALATGMAHVGTGLELVIPLLFLFAPAEALPLALLLMVLLHLFITSNVPAGVPIEWNVVVVYGAFALFSAHADVSVLELGVGPLTAFVCVMLVGLPLFGNLFPARLSFLLSMRYYAGNWPYTVWLFQGESHRKLERLTKSAPWVPDQVAWLLDRSAALAVLARTMAFRMMHLQGRAIPKLVARAVGDRDDYRYMDGEVIGGMVLGWNFGDGHLHNEALLSRVQAQCGFEPGELRVIAVESQPLGGGSLAYRIVDAQAGVLERGALPIDELMRARPWATTATNT